MAGTLLSILAAASMNSAVSWFCRRNALSARSRTPKPRLVQPYATETATKTSVLATNGNEVILAVLLMLFLCPDQYWSQLLHTATAK